MGSENKMKTVIHQVYVGDQNKLYDFCVQSVAEYCKKYEIDHVVQREPKLRIVPDVKNMGRSMASFQKLGYLPIFEKSNAFEHLNNYDAVAIIDSDIYIRKNAPNIFDELSDLTFASVVEREMPLTQKYFDKIRAYSKGQYGTLTDVDWKWNHHGAEFSNMGMMLVSNKIMRHFNGQNPKEFIQRPEFKKFVDGIGNWKWSTDQTLLNYWIKKEKMKTKNLSWKWNTLYSAVEDKYLSEAYFIHFFLRDHLPERGENIQHLLSEKGLL